MRRIITVLLILTLLLCLFVSCRTEPDPLHPAATAQAESGAHTETGKETKTAEEASLYTVPEEDLAAFIGTSGKTAIRARAGDLIACGDTVYKTYNGIVSGPGHVTKNALKYSVSTGEVTTICADPLCDHKNGSGCPFGEEVVLLDVKDDVVYYTSEYYWTIEDRKNKVDDDNRRAVYAYDLKEMKQTFLFEVYDGGLLTLVNGCIYYGCLVIDEDFNHHMYIGRYDLPSGKNDLLFNFDTYYADEYGKVHIYTDDVVRHVPLLVDEYERVYFYEFSLGLYQDLYIADLKDEEPAMKLLARKYWSTVYYRDGEMIAAIANGEYSEEDGVPYYPPCTITAFDSATGQARSLIENANGPFVLAGDCIYYTPYENYERTSPTIIRYNIETGESVSLEIPIEEPANLIIGCYGVYANGKLIVYATYKDSPGQDDGSVEDYIAIDLRTGEWSYTGLEHSVLEIAPVIDAG